MSGPNWAETAQRILGSCSCHEAYKSRGMTAPDCVWCDCSAELIEALHTAYAAGLAASGREAEIRGLETARDIALETIVLTSRGMKSFEIVYHSYELTATTRAEKIAAAIQSEIDKARALTPTEDREYREAVEKLMKEGSG